MEFLVVLAIAVLIALALRYRRWAGERPDGSEPPDDLMR